MTPAEPWTELNKWWLTWLTFFFSFLSFLLHINCMVIFQIVACLFNHQGANEWFSKQVFRVTKYQETKWDSFWTDFDRFWLSGSWPSDSLNTANFFSLPDFNYIFPPPSRKKIFLFRWTGAWYVYLHVLYIGSVQSRYSIILTI